MRTLYIMQGIPGSGKSTIAKMICEFNEDRCVIVSTDNFWYEQVGTDQTRYDYDSTRLAEAHAWAQNLCKNYMEMCIPTIIIDNTNIEQRSANSYLELAKKHPLYNVKVVRVEASLEECILRQRSRPEDRRVPEEVIRKMYDKMERIVV